jgi:hypothetical protein
MAPLQEIHFRALGWNPRDVFFSAEVSVTIKHYSSDFPSSGGLQREVFLMPD